MNNAILSIKPRFTREIYLGNKKVELRKRIGRRFTVGCLIYIYSSSPVKRITGYAKIRKIETLPVSNIRQHYLTLACIDAISFDSYFLGHEKGILIWLTDVIEFNNGPSLAKLRKMGFTPPQSFSYATNQIESLLASYK
jgi:predicted transcriptional regulator